MDPSTIISLTGGFLRFVGETVADLRRLDVSSIDVDLLNLKRSHLAEKLKDFNRELEVAVKREKGRAEQDLISRGLSNSTIRSSTLRGIESDASKELDNATREYNRAIEEIALLERKVNGLKKECGNEVERRQARRNEMTSDAHQRLRGLKDELASLEPWPWNNIAAWSAKATPIIRRDWPDDLDDFRKLIAEPRWSGSAWFAPRQGDAAVASAMAKQDSENRLVAEQAKAGILNFLEGLLTVTGRLAPLNKDQPIENPYEHLAARLLQVEGFPLLPPALSFKNVGGLSDEDDQRLCAVVCELTTGLTENRWRELTEEQRIGWMRVACNHLETRKTMNVPTEIIDSLKQFQKEHPDPSKVAFVMMRFGSTDAHTSIVDGIQQALRPFGITAVRADGKHYHDDLWPNVLTYIYGCGFGIAVFERLEVDEFNPNVSLEVGYLYGLGKSVCLLKDKTLKTLHTDLVGKLYRPFDPQDPKKTIPAELSKWLKDKGMVSPMVGKWVWPAGDIAEFQHDGTAKWLTDGGTGIWTCLDEKTRTYQVSWGNGSIDSMVLSSDVDTLDCINARDRKPFTVTRSPKP